MERRQYILAACVVVALLAAVLIARSRRQGMEGSPRFSLAPLDAVLARPYECGMAWLSVRRADGAPATPAYAAALEAAVRRRPTGPGAHLLAVGDDRIVVQELRDSASAWPVVDGAVRIRVIDGRCATDSAPAGARVFSAVLAE